MSTTQFQERLTAILTPAAEKAGLVIDGVSIASAGRRRLIRVDVDLPEDVLGSVDLDTVAAAARAISAALDSSPESSDVIGAGPYSLEVGTAGVGRPLRERRHWMRARTRLVSVTTTGGSMVTGRLQQVDDTGLHLDVGGARQVLPWSEVGVGEVQIEFRRAAPGEAVDGQADVADVADVADAADEDDDEDDDEYNGEPAAPEGAGDRADEPSDESRG